MADQDIAENPDAAGASVATGSSSSTQQKAKAKSRKLNRSSDNNNAGDNAGRAQVVATTGVAIDTPTAKQTKALKKATVAAVGILDHKITTSEIFSRVSGTWTSDKSLLCLNILGLMVISTSLGVWFGLAADDKARAIVSVVGLATAMIMLSLAMANLTEVLHEHLSDLGCHVFAGMVHATVFVPKALLTWFLWSRFATISSSGTAKNLHHAQEIICHEVVGSAVIPLLLFIPILCLRISIFDWKKGEDTVSNVLDGLTGHMRSTLHTSRLVACAFLVLVAPSLVVATGSKTIIFYIINLALLLELSSNAWSACQVKKTTLAEPQIANTPSYRDAVERARKRLYGGALLMLIILIASTTVTAWLLNMRLVHTIEYHRENKSRFPGALIGIVIIPTMTDAAALFHIFHAVENTEDAVHMIIHLVAAARNHLVFGAVFASFSSLMFQQQFLVNGAFVFSLLSFIIIMTGVSFLRWRETPTNTGAALLLLFVGFLIVTLTMPDDISAWLALLSSQGHEQQKHTGNSTTEAAGHHGFSSSSVAMTTSAPSLESPGHVSQQGSMSTDASLRTGHDLFDSVVSSLSIATPTTAIMSDDIVEKTTTTTTQVSTVVA